MDVFVSLLYRYALSIFLLILLVVAIRYVYKRRKKFDHNQFE